MFHIRLMISIGLLITVSVLCNNGNCDEQVGTVKQPAFAVSPFNPWPLSSGKLRLCFKRDKSLSIADYPVLLGHILHTLNKTWGHIPGLSFVQGCKAPAMSITLEKGNGYGYCGLGKGASCSIAGEVTDLDKLDSVAVHEVGHGLGLLHEHQRPDAPPLCPKEENILKGCQQCKNGTCDVASAKACWFSVPAASSITVSLADKNQAINRVAAGVASCLSCSHGSCAVGSCDSKGTCTPVDSYLACFGKQPTTGTLNVASVHPSAPSRVDDRVPRMNGKVLTKYDSASIMSYCAKFHGRTNDIPTDLDMLGMEMLYSTNRNYRLGCGMACFEVSGGVVTSTTGSIVAEWIARGSLGIPFKINGTSNYIYSYPVNALSNGTTKVQYTFRDPVGKQRTGSGTVTKSDSYFTAIVSALSVP